MVNASPGGESHRGFVVFGERAHTIGGAGGAAGGLSIRGASGLVSGPLSPSRRLGRRESLGAQREEQILFLPRFRGGRDAITERQLRPIAAIADWRNQRPMWGELKAGLSIGPSIQGDGIDSLPWSGVRGANAASPDGSAASVVKM